MSKNICVSNVRKTLYLLILMVVTNSFSQGYGLLPLAKAIFNKENNQAIIMMIDSAEDINLRDQKIGGTPLFYAVITENTEIVRYLIGKGANVNLQTKEFDYPLHAAEAIGNQELISILKSAGGKHINRPTWLLLPWEVRGNGDVVKTDNLTMFDYKIKGAR